MRSWHGTQDAFFPIPTSPYHGKWLQIDNGIGSVHNWFDILKHKIVCGSLATWPGST